MDVAEAVKWNVRISRALGLLPIEIPDGHSKYKVTKGRILYSLFLMAIFLCLLPIQLFLNEFWKNKFHVMVNGFIWSFVDPFVVAAAIGVNALKRKSLCAAVNSISDITVSLRNLTGGSHPTPMKRYILTFFSFWSILIISDHQNYHLATILDYLELLFAYWVISHFTIYTLILSSLLRDLKNGLNDVLEIEFPAIVTIPKPNAFTTSSIRFITDEISNKAKIPKSDRKVSEIIISYRTMYHEIFATSQDFNDSLAISNFVMVCYLGLVTLTTNFDYYALLRFPTSGIMDFLRKLEMLPWVISGPAALFMLTYPCVEVTALLHQFSTMLTHEEIYFAPYNIFKLNYSLILTISGLAFSYLIILTQLQKQTEGN